MQKQFLLILFLFLTSPFIYSQHNQDHKKGIAVHLPPSPRKERGFVPQTVVFKIRPEQNLNFIARKEKLPALQKLAREIGVVSVERMFPNVAPPDQAGKNLRGKPVDLSRIYVLKYSSPHNVNEVASMIYKTGLVEYAEPYYVDEILAVPNDPYAQPTDLQGLYLENMKFYDALDVEEGDTSVVIGIVDTGIHYDHEDLQNSIKYNYADPINGIDDDGDGYTDNFRGWDLAGNDNNPYATGNDHGTVVSGCAGATMNNGLGGTGTGGKCKLLPIKAATDDPGSSILKGYPGIIYGADHGVKVLNLSWGGPGGYSAAAQDVINYAAINKDVVVIAAAGNDATEAAYYPASYDNVLSVAGLDTMYHAGLDSIVEKPAYYATHNYYVDVGAMGRKLVSTVKGNTYTAFGGGSSFACPIVSGAAALVRSKYPSLTGLQVAELLRVTADPLIDTLPDNLPFKEEKLGKGRINIYRALTDHSSPAVRMVEKHAYNKVGEYAFSGDTLKLVCTFKNFLQPTVNTSVTLTAVSSYVTVVQGSFNIGSLGTLASLTNTTQPFIVYVHPDAPLNSTALFRLGYNDPGKNYKDYQYFEIRLNPPYVDIDTNQVTMSITNNGKFGFMDPYSTAGSGVEYKEQNLLFEGGLMIGASNSKKVVDCVRGSDPGTADADFDYVNFAKYVTLPEGDMAARVVLTDTGANRIGLLIEQRSYAYHNAPDDKYIITEYLIKNVSGASIDTLHVGIYSDWDVPNASYDRANWDSQNKIGFTYYNGTSGLFAGVCILTDHAPSCFSLDHGSIGGNNINPNDGFTTAEKYTTLSRGIGRPKAGQLGSGYDVSQVVGGSILNIANDETRTIAFAHVVGDDLLDLQQNASRARALFRQNNTSAVPMVSDKEFCQGTTAPVTIAPANGTKFNFYKAPSDSLPAYSGTTYILPVPAATDTIYVRGADSLFESSAVMSKIIIHSGLKAAFDFLPDPIDLTVSDVGYFVSTSQNAAQYSWNISDGSSYTSSSFMHTFNSAGTFKVTLTAEDSHTCTDTVSRYVPVTGNPMGVSPSIGNGISISPNPSDGLTSISFTLAAPENVSIVIFNALGAEIWKLSDSQVMSKEYPVNLSDVERGVYFARIMVGNKTAVQKIIID